MRRPHRPAALAAAVAGSLVLSACGGSSGTDHSPKGELTAGISSLAQASTLTTTVHLQTTAAALRVMAKSSGSSLDAPTAQAIATARLLLETSRSGSHGAFALQGVTGGSTVVEVRVVNQVIYLHADVRTALSLLHKPGVYANLRAQTKSMPPFVQSALAGQWVSLNASALSGLAGGGASGGSSAAQGPKLLGDLKDIVSRDVTVTKAGSDSRGDHLVLTGDAGKLTKDLRSSIETSIPGGAVLSQRLPSGPVQHRNVTVDAWVKGGVLTELSLDLAQFGKSGQVPAGTTLPLVFTFDRSGAVIAAPSGAVPVDLTQLGSLIGAFGGG